MTRSKANADGRTGGLGGFVRSPVNWLLVFVPMCIVLDRVVEAPAAARFACAALAILPLASLLISATEQIAQRTGQAVGGLLNATFGNAPELIITGVALRTGDFDLVRAAIVGGILGNLLFGVGVAFFAGGLKHHVQEYNPRGTRVQSSMLLVAAISLIVPSVFHNFIAPETVALEQSLSAAVSVVLLVTYGLSLVFMLGTHPDYYAAPEGEGEAEEHTRWPLSAAVGALVGCSVVLAVVSEILVGSVEATAQAMGLSKAFIGVIFLALLGGFAETMAAVVMARRNKMDLAMGIAEGSSIQIAMFVAPVLVLASYAIAPTPMNLVLGNAGVVTILLAVLISSMVSGDGQSNWFKGLQLIAVYVLFALFCFYLPDNIAAPVPGP